MRFSLQTRRTLSSIKLPSLFFFINKTTHIYYNYYKLPQCLRFIYGTYKFTLSKDLSTKTRLLIPK